MAKIFPAERRDAWVLEKNHLTNCQAEQMFLKIHTWIHFCISLGTKKGKEKNPKIYESKREREKWTHTQIQGFLKFPSDMHILQVNNPFVYKLDLFREMFCNFNYHLLVSGCQWEQGTSSQFWYFLAPLWISHFNVKIPASFSHQPQETSHWLSSGSQD